MELIYQIQTETNMNKVILIGNLGNDPETHYLASGVAVTKFNLATTERYTKKDGERQEHTEWHRIVVWGKLAEICGEYLSKGSKAGVEGRIQTNEWEDKEGNKRETKEIIANNVEFLGGNKPKETARGASTKEYEQDDHLPF